MRKVLVLVVSIALAVLTTGIFAPSAGAFVCHDHPGGCCDAPILGKFMQC